MSGNLRFESASAGADELAIAGGHLNGNRASHSRSSLDRSGSFRESCENRMLSTLTSLSGENSTSNGDVPPISDCLMLDPITLGDQKCQGLGELRKILGIPLGSNAEESSFGAGGAKLPHPGAVERFKLSVSDTSTKARYYPFLNTSYLHCHFTLGELHSRIFATFSTPLRLSTRQLSILKKIAYMHH